MTANHCGESYEDDALRLMLHTVKIMFRYRWADRRKTNAKDVTIGNAGRSSARLLGLITIVG